MVMGSSGLPAMLISCMSALPIDVTRIEVCIGLPSTVPAHDPARVFRLSKDFCASDWAKAAVGSPSNTTASRKRCILILLIQPGSRGGDALGSTVILNYNTISLSIFFLPCSTRQRNFLGGPRTAVYPLYVAVAGGVKGTPVGMPGE